MKYYTIGEFSRITGLSHKALRIYHRKDILKPSYTDPDTSYRYYNNMDLIESNIIKDLKNFGCSLNEIKMYLENRNRPLLHKLYSEKLAEIENDISHLQNISRTIRFRLQVPGTGNPGEVILKNIPARKVIFTRYKSPCNPESFAKRFFELSELLRKKSTGSGRYMAIFHDDHVNFDYASADIEVAAEVERTITDENIFRLIPDDLYLTIIVKGPYSGLVEGYKIIMNFAGDNGLIKSGPAIELYHSDFASEAAAESFITELQVPVKFV